MRCTRSPACVRFFLLARSSSGLGDRCRYVACKMNTRTVSYFFTSNDERELTSSILAQFPNAKLIDALAWAKTLDITEASRRSIADCATNCYVWDPDSVPDFPADSKPTYHVAHFSRCRFVDGNTLYLGQTGLLVNPDDDRQKRFCNKIIRLIRELKSGAIDAYNCEDDSLAGSGITNFVVGPDAYARSGLDLTLAYGNCYYKPNTTIAT